MRASEIEASATNVCLVMSRICLVTLEAATYRMVSANIPAPQGASLATAQVSERAWSAIRGECR